MVEVQRRIIFGSPAAIQQILEADGCGQMINTSYIERDNLTSRHCNGRLVRKTLSHSRKNISCNSILRWKMLTTTLCDRTAPYASNCVVPKRMAANGSNAHLLWLLA